MAVILDIVRPGDVISSDLLNRIIALLNEHDAALVGSGTTNLINGFNPPMQQNVGSNFVIFGTFDFPLQSNTLTIDNVPIQAADFLFGSNSTQLVVQIPTSISVPPATTRQVTVRVVNSQGQGERPYLLMPSLNLPVVAITDLVDHASGIAPLRSQNDGRITGLNFASPASSNRVRLIFNPGQPNETSFPADPNGSLVINSAASVINPSPMASTLVAMMPVITAALIPLPGGQAPVVIQVTVPNIGTDDMGGVQIRRTA